MLSALIVVETAKFLLCQAQENLYIAAIVSKKEATAKLVQTEVSPDKVQELKKITANNLKQLTINSIKS
jgi:hypothetical protein